MTEADRTILLVDDSLEDRTAFIRYLTRDPEHTYQCFEAQNGVEALACVRSMPIDCVVLDHHLPDTDGLELLVQIMEMCRTQGIAHPAFVMVTGSGNESIAVAAIKQGAHDYLVKATINANEIRRAVSNAIEKSQLQRQIEQQREQMEEQRMRLQRILETTSEGIVLLDAEGRIELANHAVERMSDKKREAFYSLYHDDPRWQITTFDNEPIPRDELAVTRALRNNETITNAQIIARHPDGTPVYLSLNVAPLRDRFGKVEGVVASFRDITESWHNQQERQNQSEEFERTLNTIPAIVARFDQNLRHIYVNSEVERATGLPRSAFIGKTNQDLGMPADLCVVWDEALRQVFETGKPNIITFSTPFLNRPHHFQARIAPEVAPDGTVRSVISVALDQTEQREAEAALQLIAQASDALGRSLDFETILTTLAELVLPHYADRYTFDRLQADGTLIRVATATIDQATPNGIRIDFDQASVPVEEAATLHEVLQQQQPLLVLLEQKQDDDKAQDPGEMRASTLRIPLMSRATALGILTLHCSAQRPTFSTRDQSLMSELGRRAATAIDNSFLYQEAQNAIREREVFLSIASHELKNPLASMLGRAELLQRRATRDNNDQRTQRDAQIILDQGKRMSALLNDLLDVSRIDMGMLQVSRDRVDLVSLIRRIENDIQPTLVNHTLEMSLPQRELIVIGDSLRIDQVVRNLLSNAIKYSPAGGRITLKLSKSRESAMIAVSDQGIGIPESAIPHLFQRFYRVENAQAAQIGGSGIGLYVVREIVQTHGGSIEVASKENQGSTFTVRLPLAN